MKKYNPDPTSVFMEFDGEVEEVTVGWCKGESVTSRPKRGETAIMVNKDDRQFWFHLRNNEVFEIYK